MNFEDGPLCFYVPTCDPRGGASFNPKGHHMNKAGLGLQGDDIYKNMKVLGLPVSERKNFEFCLLCSYVQTCDPRGGGQSWPPGASYEQTW